MGGILEKGETRLYEREETDIKNRTAFKAKILNRKLRTRSVDMLRNKCHMAFEFIFTHTVYSLPARRSVL